MGTALLPGNGTTFALEAQTDQRQLAGGRDLHGLTTPNGKIVRLLSGGHLVEVLLHVVG